MQGPQSNQAILEGSKTLNSGEALQSYKSHFTLALWRMNHGRLPHSIASLDVMSETRAFTILNDQCFVSHDRSYIFILTVSEAGALEDMILAHTDFLEQPQIGQIDISQLGLSYGAITGSPCLIYGDPSQFVNPSQQNEYLLYLPLGKKGLFCRISTVE